MVNAIVEKSQKRMVDCCFLLFRVLSKIVVVVIGNRRKERKKGEKYNQPVPNRKYKSERFVKYGTLAPIKYCLLF
jgi:hypothetical protein